MASIKLKHAFTIKAVFGFSSTNAPYVPHKIAPNAVTQYAARETPAACFELKILIACKRRDKHDTHAQTTII